MLEHAKLNGFLHPHLQPLPGVFGIHLIGGARFQHRHLIRHPVATALRFQTRDQFEIDIAQMRHVGERVIKLLVAQRPAAPVGKPGGFVDGSAGNARNQLVVGNRFAETADHGRNLRVENRVRNQIAAIDDNFDVLPRRVKHLDHGRVRHQIKKWFEINAFRQGVNNALILRTCHLDQAEFGPVGRLAQELGVNGDIVVACKAGAEGGKRLGRCNHVHDWPLPRKIRFVLPPRPIGFSCFRLTASGAIHRLCRRPRSGSSGAPRTIRTMV